MTGLKKNAQRDSSQNFMQYHKNCIALLLPIIAYRYLYFHNTITRNHLLKQPKIAATPDTEERALMPKNNKTLTN